MWYVSATKMGIDMSDMSEFPQKEYYVLALFCCASFLDCYSTLLHVSSASFHAFVFLSITKYTKCTLSYKEPEQLIKVKQFCEGKNYQLKVMAKTNLILVGLLITAPLSSQ